MYLLHWRFSKLNTNEGERLLSRSNTADDDKKVKGKNSLVYYRLFSIQHHCNIQYYPEIVSHTAHTIGSQFEIIALAGIGMRVKIQRFHVKDRTKSIVIRRRCKRLSSWNRNWSHIYLLWITFKKSS